MKKSTTILLLQWFKTLGSCGLPLRMMPRNVSTRWNSTYDMLYFALNFRPAIDSMTAMCDLDLRKYELSLAEWGVAKELRDVLKVCFPLLNYLLSLINEFRPDIQGRNIVFFPVAPRALPQSSQPWTISINSLIPRPTVIGFRSPFTRPSLSARTPSTGIIPRQTGLKLIGSQ